MHLIVDARNLTSAEQELIRAAVGNQGVLEVATRAETHGRAVVAGRKRFFDPKDRSVAAEYISLLARLKELELIHEIWLVNSSFREWVWVTCEFRRGDFVGRGPFVTAR